MHARTTATDLARWIEQQGGHWHVEGEPALTKSLPMPAPASSLVDALARRDGSLAMLLPEACLIAADASIRAEEIASAAHLVDGQRVFQLAWIDADGSLRDSWLLCEQSMRISAPDGDAECEARPTGARRASSAPGLGCCWSAWSS